MPALLPSPVREFHCREGYGSDSHVIICKQRGPGGSGRLEVGEGSPAMTLVRDLHRRWMQNPEYRAEYEKLGPEFDLAYALIEARAKAGLTQEELARRMETTQSAIARLESGRVRPSSRTLERFAEATGTRLKIRFEPDPALSAAE